MLQALHPPTIFDLPGRRRCVLTAIEERRYLSTSGLDDCQKADSQEKRFFAIDLLESRVYPVTATSRSASPILTHETKTQITAEVYVVKKGHYSRQVATRAAEMEGKRSENARSNVGLSAEVVLRRHEVKNAEQWLPKDGGRLFRTDEGVLHVLVFSHDAPSRSPGQRDLPREAQAWDEDGWGNDIGSDIKLSSSAMRGPNDSGFASCFTLAHEDWQPDKPDEVPFGRQDASPPSSSRKSFDGSRYWSMRDEGMLLMHLRACDLGVPVRIPSPVPWPSSWKPGMALPHGSSMEAQIDVAARCEEIRLTDCPPPNPTGTGAVQASWAPWTPGQPVPGQARCDSASSNDSTIELARHIDES